MDARPEFSNNEPTLMEVLARLRQDGYEHDLASLPGGRVHCARDGVTSPAGAWTIEVVRRLEGLSDPEEQVIVLGVRGPPQGCRGALVLGYGPTASPEDAGVLEEIGLSGR